MRTLLRIMKTELSILFYSPIAWLILIVFAFQTGMAFYGLFSEELRYQSLGYSSYGLTSGLLGGFEGVYATMLNNLYLYIPLLTMGLMSRELNSGSIKLLYSSPVSNRQIILGKYFATLVYGLILIFILAIPLLFSAATVKDFDWPMALTALLGVYFVICAYSAIGLFMSAVTSYQVVAAIGTMAILALLNFIGGVGQSIAFVRDITFWLSISGRSAIFMDGLICSQDLLYFVLVVVLFLSLSVIKLQAERLRNSVWIISAKYIGVVAIVLFIGYLSTIPTLIYYYDATSTKINTLTENSRNIVNQLEGDLTITTYVNVLDRNYSKGMPHNLKMDVEKFDKYIRFKPEIKFNYVYYYANANYSALERRFPGATDREKMLGICEVNDFDPDLFKSPEEIAKSIDLSAENYRFVRVIESENGKRAFLRIYEDQQRDPSETEITVALKTLLCKSPVVGFVAGHDERGFNDVGEKGYGPFAQERTFRHSLVNQGFDTQEILLDTEVPEHIDIIVIADMKSELTEAQHVNLDKFVARGGNMIVAGENKRQNFMNPVVEKFGVKFLDHLLVQPTKEYSADLIVAKFTDAAAQYSPLFEPYLRKNTKITMPSACGLEYQTDKGFRVTEILVTNEKGVWNETKPFDLINETPQLDTLDGDVQRSFPVMLSLTRQVQNKEQRIFILGDADCMSSAELSKRRAGIKASNFVLITELFGDLSYGEYPIKTSRTRPTDDNIKFSYDHIVWVKIVLMWLIPIGLSLTTIILLLRRKRK